MAWDGSGNFTRDNGTNSGSETWQDDAAAGTKIRADRHDTHDQDLADGVAACLTKNNESKPTADFVPNADATYDLGSSSAGWTNAYLTGDVVFDERADHAETPAAGKGQIWVRSDSPSSLQYTDDADTDHQLSPIYGTFTPTIADDTAGTDDSQTYSSREGRYMKWGRLVHCQILISLSSKGSMTAGNSVYIHTLPYTAWSGTGNAIGSVSVPAGANITAGQVITASVLQNTDFVSLKLWDATSGHSPLLVSEITDTFQVNLSITYESA